MVRKFVECSFILNCLIVLSWSDWDYGFWESRIHRWSVFSMSRVYTVTMTHHYWVDLLTLISCVYQVIIFFLCFALGKQVTKHNPNLKVGEVVLYLWEWGIFTYITWNFFVQDIYSPPFPLFTCLVYISMNSWLS